MQRISQAQLGLMLILFHFSTGTGFLISPVAQQSSYQGWMVLLLAASGGLLLGYFATALGNRLADLPIVDGGGKIIGKWPHFVLLGILVLFVLHLSAVTLRQFSDFLIQTYLATTPSWMISGMMAFCAAVAVRSGVEAIFRCATGFFFVIMSTLLTMPFLIGREMKFQRAVALVTHLDIPTLLGSAYMTLPWFGEMVIVLFFIPYLANRQKTFRTLVLSTSASIFLIILNYVLCMLIFGPFVTGHLTYPVLEMIRYIRIGDFLENLDPLLVSIWTTSLFIKISVLQYIVVETVSHSFKLKDHRPFSFSLGAVMVGLSIQMANSSIDLFRFLEHSWPTFALTVELIPLLYWAVSLARKQPAMGGKRAG